MSSNLRERTKMINIELQCHEFEIEDCTLNPDGTIDDDVNLVILISTRRESLLNIPSLISNLLNVLRCFI
jgi:hypothetical protein